MCVLYAVWNWNEIKFSMHLVSGLSRRHNGKSMRIRKNYSTSSMKHNHKLFCGDLLSFIQVPATLYTFIHIFLYSIAICDPPSSPFVVLIQASEQQIPVVVQSCVCFINLNGKHKSPWTQWCCRRMLKGSIRCSFYLLGLHHEGIFRVPGSQMEINNLRDAFERGRWVCESRPATPVFTTELWVSPVGEDPLSERAYDLDSVAGVLKLYFRTLEKPLFPTESTSQLLEHARK